MAKEIKKFQSEEELIAEAIMSGIVHRVKDMASLEVAIESLPMEFWTRLNEKQQDEVESRLKKHFKEEGNEGSKRSSN